MHQPFYKDLASGQYRLPWTRMHALKDYYGMVKILEEFPQIHQTFNLVPSMIVQVDEYARGVANDPFLACALKPAEQLSWDEKAVMLRNFFLANPARMIYRYPRFGELYNAHLNAKSGTAVSPGFGPQDFRDLQVWSQLAWFDEDLQANDPEVRSLIAKDHGFTLEDQALMGRKQREICSLVIPQYRKLADSGQIEISTTPFYHPILPLLCDSDIAAVSHPHVPLPPRFQYPEDARLQLQMSRDYIAKVFGHVPAGLWPSEGSVSDHALDLAASIGFSWAATDNGVLERTLRRGAGPDISYRPWRWSQQDKSMQMIFRDHQLSDLIGFVYSGMSAEASAADFVNRIAANCGPIIASGRDALVPVILDGENAWEYYDQNGRPFFRELYSRIENDPRMEALTVSEALARVPADGLDHIFPGSWINANFDVWIGAEEDNLSWSLLLKARQAYAEHSVNVPEASRAMAMEELLIAEGSDWNWWYGPEHDSENRIEFDQIYREHLANVYRALGIPAPAELSCPILKVQAVGTHTSPGGPVTANVNGKVDSYFEWLGAGVYQVDQRSGSMHGNRALVKELRYGCNQTSVFLLVDFEQDISGLKGLEVHVDRPGGDRCTIRLDHANTSISSGEGCAAFRDVLEISVPLSDRIRLSFWVDGLPVQSVPPQDFLTVSAPVRSCW